VLTLINKIRKRFPQVNILLTTGTVTSAELMRTRLPKEVIHQYAPVDTPQATISFIRHWKPDLAFWIESEFWPNLIEAADYYQCFMGVINARLSDRSFQSWQKHPALIKRMLHCFNIVFRAERGRCQAAGIARGKGCHVCGQFEIRRSLIALRRSGAAQAQERHRQRTGMAGGQHTSGRGKNGGASP